MTQDLNGLAKRAVNSVKRGYLQSADYQDALSTCLEEACVLQAAYSSGGLDEVLYVSMRRAAGRWWYGKRKLWAHEGLSGSALADGVHEDVYFYGDEDNEHRP